MRINVSKLWAALDQALLPFGLEVRLITVDQQQEEPGARFQDTGKYEVGLGERGDKRLPAAPVAWRRQPAKRAGFAFGSLGHLAEGAEPAPCKDRNSTTVRLLGDGRRFVRIGTAKVHIAASDGEDDTLCGKRLAGFGAFAFGEERELPEAKVCGSCVRIAATWSMIMMAVSHEEQVRRASKQGDQADEIRLLSDRIEAWTGGRFRVHLVSRDRGADGTICSQPLDTGLEPTYLRTVLRDRFCRMCYRSASAREGWVDPVMPARP